MTVDTDDDAMLGVLRRLPAATPDIGRSDATRERCRAVLVRAHVKESRRRDRARVLEPAIVGAFSLAYLAAIVLDVLRLQAGR